MKEKYYISAYCSIDPLGNILSPPVRHDQNIALWKNVGDKVELLSHWEIERISGLKHHQTDFFSEADFLEFINQRLKEFELTNSDIQAYIGVKNLTNAVPLEFDCKFAYHSLCHLYSSMGMNSDIFYNEKTLALALDAEPDMCVDNMTRNKFYFAGAYVNKGDVELFPISSPGILWTVAATALNMQEGSLMALASASKSEAYISYDLPKKIVNKEDNLRAQKIFGNVIKDILSYCREDMGIKFNYFDERFTEIDNKISMIIKILQKWSIDMVDRNIKEAIDRFAIDCTETNIALAGGYCLNCPTNTYIMNKYKFKKQLMVPCVNDGGQAIGIGLKYFYDHFSKVDIDIRNPYCGNHSEEYDHKFDYYIKSVDEGIERVVQDIIEGPIIWFMGRAEIGPRALGHRSLLGDPRYIETKDKLNKIKQRQWWRPVAPMILEDLCSEWFEDSFISPYMLNNFSIKLSKAAEVPAILHLDYTCRVQTVSKQDSLLYDVLEYFYKETGVPILCNTSLNDKGEPIIDNINQTFNFALRKGIKVVYINGKRYELWHFEKYSEKSPYERDHDMFTRYRNNDGVCKAINPYGITEEEYNTYLNSDLEEDFDFQDYSDVKKFKRLLKKMIYMYNQYTGYSKNM